MKDNKEILLNTVTLWKEVDVQELCLILINPGAKLVLAIRRITLTFQSWTAFTLHKPSQIGADRIKHV